MCRKYNVHGRIEVEGTGGAHPLPRLLYIALVEGICTLLYLVMGPWGWGFAKAQLMYFSPLRRKVH